LAIESNPAGFHQERVIQARKGTPTQASDCAEQEISAANATLCLPGAFAYLNYAFPMKAADAHK
jgi:hypothetical protein